MTKTISNLVRGLVDYAGLFPPAQLDMAAAAAEYARQRESGDAWILARFVVPVGRLDELAGELPGGDPWPLSVLAGADPEADRQQIDAFNESGRAATGRAVIESVELKASSAEEIAAKAPVFAALETYFEIPHDEDPGALMRALAEHGASAKIRTGGIVADAIPSSAEVARFIVAAARTGVAFKATAGLHHPLRGEYRLTYEADSASATMHGYVNVFLAAALVRRYGLREGEIQALLEERDPQAFEVADRSVRWRGHTLDHAAIAEAREGFATSYGSCSFREPVDELRQLHLIE